MADDLDEFNRADGQPAAVIVFNTHYMETPDDAAIERLVQEVCRFMIRRAEKRGMAMGDVICATQEMMSRFLVAPFAGMSRDRAGEEKIINDMMAIATRRAIALLDAEGPGSDQPSN